MHWRSESTFERPPRYLDALLRVLSLLQCISSILYCFTLLSDSTKSRWRDFRYIIQAYYFSSLRHIMLWCYGTYSIAHNTLSWSDFILPVAVITKDSNRNGCRVGKIALMTLPFIDQVLWWRGGSRWCNHSSPEFLVVAQRCSIPQWPKQQQPLLDMKVEAEKWVSNHLHKGRPEETTECRSPFIIVRSSISSPRNRTCLRVG